MNKLKLWFSYHCPAGFDVVHKESCWRFTAADTTANSAATHTANSAAHTAACTAGNTASVRCHSWRREIARCSRKTLRTSQWKRVVQLNYLKLQRWTGPSWKSPGAAENKNNHENYHDDDNNDDNYILLLLLTITIRGILKKKL